MDLQLEIPSISPKISSLEGLVSANLYKFYSPRAQNFAHFHTMFVNRMGKEKKEEKTKQKNKKNRENRKCDMLKGH